jgi:PhoPQ-activated pathogenicity-related protein
MTKSAVRAMDMLVDFAAKELKFEMGKFIVAGASKRGWTTWTTGAVDSRVVGIIPMVMDLLNMHENLHHMYRNLGGWTFAFDDYFAFNFTGRIDDPGLIDLASIVDPYVYRERLTMPKLVIDSGGDEFFQPDDNYFWWDDMPGEKHLLMLQDAEHSLITGVPELIQSVISLVHSINIGEQRPSMSWTFNDTFDGSSIIVECSEPPKEIYVRYADTLDGLRRDWRLITGQKPCPTVVVDGACLHPVLWHEQDPIEIAPNTYKVTFDNPSIGWRAFFIEAKFRSDSLVPFIFTTQVNIVPHTYAFPDCHGAECRGTLL